MATANRRDAVPASLRKGERLIVMAKPVEGIADLLAPLEAEQTKYQTSYQSWLEARRVDRLALGEQHEAEKVLDNERRTFGYAVLAAGRGRRNSPLYRSYFKDGFGPTLDLSVRQSLNLTSGLIAALEHETNPDLIAHKEKLQAAYDALSAALAKRQTTSDAMGKARSLLQAEKWEWQKVFNTFYYALRVHFPDRRTWIASLFIAAAKPAPDEEETPDGTETDNPNPVALTAPAPASSPSGGDVVPAPQTAPDQH